MKVQEAVAVYGVETVCIKDLLVCIIGDALNTKNRIMASEVVSVGIFTGSLLALKNQWIFT